MIRGLCVRFDDGFINYMFDLPIVEDEYEAFLNFVTIMKRNKIFADLCVSCIIWTVSPKGRLSVKRLALNFQARGWNHFLKASLMPTSYNETISEERMALLHSIIKG
ncbi:hypothetical protein V6N11_028174 [Hibiscus sabdariffa]|uniref:Uncharacterized protein n=2 Tax=Hibiscus sabdariffa TaxID=183260 RepID=A0ABR2CV21_9ROSI